MYVKFQNCFTLEKYKPSDPPSVVDQLKLLLAVENVKIYEIKASANDNYLILNDIEGKSFYWNDAKFVNNELGDYVFVINRTGKEALFTRLAQKGLNATYNTINGLSRFVDKDSSFNVRGKWQKFIRFDVLERKTLSAKWNWTTPIRHSETYDLWKANGDLIGQVKRVEKIKDLENVFTGKKAKQILQQCTKQFLGQLPQVESYETDEATSLVTDDSMEKRSSEGLSLTVDFMDANNEHRQILMAAKTKPFVLLAGISGIGKSRLVRTLAYKTCAISTLQRENPLNFLLIQVRPNWDDSTELLGYESGISGFPEYKITIFMKFLLQALKYPEIPFFLCMDEMNLAPVELYLAEYLSAIESRMYKNGMLLTDSLIPAHVFDKFKKEEFWKNLDILQEIWLQEYLLKNGLGIPENLIVIGTVNMDETTHSFSRKVLDRAMTIEMNNVDLKAGLKMDHKDWEYPDRFYSKDLVCGTIISGGEAYSLFPEAEQVLDLLVRINEILDKTPFKIAYRVRDESLIYCYHHSFLRRDGEPWLSPILDEIICMKILSRIEGDETNCSEVLEGLRKIFEQEKFEICTYKVQEMINRLKSGYTSFFP